jgi:hypothetical protein
MGTAKMLSTGLSPGFVADSSPLQKLPAGNGPDNNKRFLPRRDRIGQWGIRRLMGQILLAGKEAQERPTLLRDLVADRPAQHGIAGLKRVEDRPQRDRAVELKFYFAADVRQRPEMLRDYDSDHFGIPLHL